MVLTKRYEAYVILKASTIVVLTPVRDVISHLRAIIPKAQDSSRVVQLVRVKKAQLQEVKIPTCLEKDKEQ